VWLPDPVRRISTIVGLAVGAGAIGGTGALALEWFVLELTTAHLATAPIGLVAVVVGAGLIASRVVLHSTATSAAMADDLLRGLRGDIRLATRPALARLAATLATVGAGAPLGIEAPSAYGGGVVGTTMARRVDAEARRLIVAAGVAGAVACLFRAPVAGALFAIEVPYRRGFDRRVGATALLGGVAGALPGWWRHGTEPRFGRFAALHLDVRTVIGVIAVGFVAALVARAFATIVAWAKRVGGRTWVAGAAAMLVMATVVAVGVVDSTAVAVSPGPLVLERAFAPTTSIGVLAVLLVARGIGAAGSVAAGGAGGLFVPLLVLGALSGRLVGAALDADVAVVIVAGAMATLGTGYRVPLTATALAWEVTRRSPLVLAAGVAVAIATTVGRASVTAAQSARP
jgi:CIC family chloride channel protein